MLAILEIMEGGHLSSVPHPQKVYLFMVSAILASSSEKQFSCTFHYIFYEEFEQTADRIPGEQSISDIILFVQMIKHPHIQLIYSGWHVGWLRRSTDLENV